MYCVDAIRGSEGSAAMDETEAPHRRHDALHATAELETDPVCGMRVDATTSRHRFELAGRVFHFCSSRCRQKISVDPSAYLQPRHADVAPMAPPGTLYTCPMHPEVRQLGPGSCP